MLRDAIDLNCDVGESFGAFTIGDDPVVMEYISSANIACGFHAGDPAVIRRTIRKALGRNVAIGAHPAFPDLVGFGRREMRCGSAEVEDLVLYQVSALAGMTRAEGGRLQHVKPHGALYNMAATDLVLASAICRAIAALDSSLLIFAPPGSALATAAGLAGLRAVPEGFADRAYELDGSLVPRVSAGSVIHDPATVAARVIRMVRDHAVETIHEKVISLDVESICVHGDTIGAPLILRAVRDGLRAEGIGVRSPGSRTESAKSPAPGA